MFFIFQYNWGSQASQENSDDRKKRKSGSVGWSWDQIDSQRRENKDPRGWGAAEKRESQRTLKSTPVKINTSDETALPKKEIALQKSAEGAGKTSAQRNETAGQKNETVAPKSPEKTQAQDFPEIEINIDEETGSSAKGNSPAAPEKNQQATPVKDKQVAMAKNPPTMGSKKTTKGADSKNNGSKEEKAQESADEILFDEVPFPHVQWPSESDSVGRGSQTEEESNLQIENPGEKAEATGAAKVLKKGGKAVQLIDKKYLEELKLGGKAAIEIKGE